MYSAYLLREDCRQKLLERFRPKYPDVICHHVTVEFPVEVDSIPPPMPKNCQVIGYASIHGLETLVVEVDYNIFRKDGSLFHITHSLDRRLGMKPVHSKDLVNTCGYIPVAPTTFFVTPVILNE